MLDLSIHLKYRPVRDEMEVLYDLFDPTRLPLCASMSPGEIEEAEDRFLQLFSSLLEKSDFKTLSQAELEFAEKDQYLLTVPLSVQLQHLDPMPLGRQLDRKFTAPSTDKTKNSHQFSRHFFLYHRGTSVDRTEARLIFEKLDFLLYKMVAMVASHLPYRDPIQTPLRRELDLFGMHTSNTNVIKRIRLLDRATIRSLIYKTVVQEPAFQQVIVLFRPRPGSATERALVEHGHGGKGESRTVQPFCIRSFCDVPMADVEAVFPETKLGIKPVDRLIMLLTAIFGMTAVGAYMTETSESTESFFASRILRLLLTLGVGFLLYMLRVGMTYITTMTYYSSILANSLLHKLNCSNRGALSFLTMAVHNQEFRVVALAWFFAIRQPSFLVSELEELCTQFLQQNGPPLCYNAADAVHKLLELGLVTSEPDADSPPNASNITSSAVKYKALPLDKAMEALELYCRRHML